MSPYFKNNIVHLPAQDAIVLEMLAINETPFPSQISVKDHGLFTVQHWYLHETQGYKVMMTSERYGLSKDGWVTDMYLKYSKGGIGFFLEKLIHEILYAS